MLGIAASHAPAIFCPPEVWPTVYDGIPDYTRHSQPHTAKLETADVIKQHVARVETAFEVMRAVIAAYKPDAIIYIGDDQGDMFNQVNMPTFAVFTAESLWGQSLPRYMAEEAAKSRVDVPVHAGLANRILKGLVHYGFDPANLAKMEAVGHPERGMSHMLIHPHPRLVPNNDIPVVPIFINEGYPPLPSAQRCWDLGLALRDILSHGPERVVLYASGGLSHDPHGPRAGWIDEPLDQWVLERLERNQAEQLTNLFTFDSDTLRGGTAEIRAWITVAAAMQRPAKVIDYFPSHHAKCGLAFAYWPLDEAAD